MTKFILDRKGLGHFLRGDEVKEEMERRAKKIQAHAIAIAPVGRNDRTIGAAKKGAKRYKDSFKVSTGVRRRPEYKTERAYARVENTKTYAVYVEYGVKRTVVDDNGAEHIERINAHHTLGRAIDAARY